jgi:hypothetical protein
MLGRWIPTGYSCNPLLVCEVDGFQKAILGVLYWYVRYRIPAGYSWRSLLVCEVDGFQQAILVILYWYVR